MHHWEQPTNLIRREFTGNFRSKVKSWPCWINGNFATNCTRIFTPWLCAEMQGKGKVGEKISDDFVGLYGNLAWAWVSRVWAQLINREGFLHWRLLRHWNRLPRRCWSHCPWKYSKTWMWHLGMGFRGEHSSAELRAGLNELKGFSQP